MQQLDVGYLFGNATGNATALRAYWSNKSFTAGVTQDVPHEHESSRPNGATPRWNKNALADNGRQTTPMRGCISDDDAHCCLFRLPRGGLGFFRLAFPTRRTKLRGYVGRCHWVGLVFLQRRIPI